MLFPPATSVALRRAPCISCSPATKTSRRCQPVFLSTDSGSFEFKFSSRLSPTGLTNGSMTSANELFFNGQIRPMKQSHLQRPWGNVPPFLDLCIDESADSRGRDLKALGAKYSHRKARSMSPLHITAEYEWHSFSTAAGDRESEAKENKSSETTPSGSTSPSRSSSSGRNSKKWIFLKDLLHRSKSEGRANNEERFWSSISISPAKEGKKAISSPALSPSSFRDEKKVRRNKERSEGTGGRKTSQWRMAVEHAVVNTRAAFHDETSCIGWKPWRQHSEKEGKGKGGREID